MIDKPIKILGQAGTVFEVTGGEITVDFGPPEKYMSMSTTNNNTASLMSIDLQDAKVLKIKKSTMAVISECEVLFNRLRAAELSSETEQNQKVSQMDFEEETS